MTSDRQMYVGQSYATRLVGCSGVSATDLRPSRRSSQSQRRRLCSWWVLRLTLLTSSCPRVSSRLIICSAIARSAWKASTATSTDGWLCTTRTGRKVVGSGSRPRAFRW